MTNVIVVRSARSLVSVIPDAVSAALFLYAWIFPLGHPSLVKALMLVMLIEFLALHSGGMLSDTVRAEKSRESKTARALCLGLLYAAFVVGFSLAFDTWWPAAWFVWLLGGKLFAIWFDDHNSSSGERARAYSILVLAMFLYLGGVMLTLLLPWPRLGLTQDVVAQIGFDSSMSGVWVEQPHRLIAFGFLYFVGLACGRGWQAWHQRGLFAYRGKSTDAS